MTSTTNYTSTHIVSGDVQSITYAAVTNGDPQLDEFFADARIIIYKGDPLAKILTPYCMDGENHVFMDEIYPKIFKPNTLDIERCYYTFEGIPEAVYRYYTGIVMVDAVRGDGSRFSPRFVDIFLKNIPSLITLNII